MKTRRLFLILLLPLLALCIADAQTQQGVVRTIQRPNKKAEYLSGVEIKQRGPYNSVVSDKKGLFELGVKGLRPGDAFALAYARKNGYELANNNTAFVYSPSVPMEVVMLNIKEKQAEEDRISANAFKSAEKKFKERIAGLEKQLAEKTISEESYRMQYQDLNDKYEKIESNIGSLAEYYASSDYARIPPVGVEINIAIENGDLDRADSLLSVISLGKLKEEHLQKSARLAEEAKNIANLYYSKITLCLLRFDNDSAAYYITELAEMDTTNVEFQLQAGFLVAHFLSDYGRALSYYKRALRYVRLQYGETSNYAIECHILMALLYQDMEDCSSAYEYSNKALGQLTQGDFNKPRLITLCYMIIGNYHEIHHEFSEAQEYYLKALESTMKMSANELLDYHSKCLIALGRNHLHQGNYTMALEYYNNVLDISKNNKKSYNHNIYLCYIGIGNVYNEQGNHSKALDFYQKALDYCIAGEGENGSGVWSGCFLMAKTYAAKHDYAKALEYFQKSLAVAERILTKNHVEVAFIHEYMGGLYYEQGEYDKALESMKKALIINETAYGTNNLKVSDGYYAVGNIYLSKKDYDNALDSYKKAANIIEVTYGGTHPALANICNKLGEICYTFNQDSIALNLYKKALDIGLAFGENQPNVAETYNNIGDIYYSKCEYSKALEYYQKALKIKLSILDENHLDVVTSYKYIGDVYYCQEDYSKALEYYNKALEIQLAVLGDENEDVASSYSGIGLTYYSMGEYGKAVEFCNKALCIMQSILGEDHPDVIAIKKEIEEIKIKE